MSSIKVEAKGCYILLAFIGVFLMVLLYSNVQPGNVDDKSILNLGGPNDSDQAANPVLSNPDLNLDLGNVNDSIFNFTVVYTDASNITPSYVNISLVHENATLNYTLASTSDDYEGGSLHYLNTTLPLAGNYSYFYVSSNGVNQTRFPEAGYFKGPSVADFFNYTLLPVSFQWIDDSGSVDIPAVGPSYQDTFDLPFRFKMYNYSSGSVQLSHFGFFRFIESSNYFPILIPSASSNTRFSGVLVSDEILSVCTSGNSSYTIKNGSDYFLVQQNLSMMNPGGPERFEIEYQFILYENGSVLFNIDHVNLNFVVSERIGLNYGDGTHFTPYTYSANLSSISLLFFYPVNSTFHSTAVDYYPVTPSSGNETVIFDFSLRYYNLENAKPYQVLLVLDGEGYVLLESDPSDLDCIDGKSYNFSITNLNPSIPHNYSYHVESVDGWYNSSTLFGPALTWDGPSTGNYSVGKNLLFEWYDPIGFSSVGNSQVMVSLPFDFSFYGMNISELVISPDGFIKFRENYDLDKPVIGGQDDASMFSLSLLGDEFTAGTGYYRIESDYLVIFYDDVYYFNASAGSNSFLGDFEIIIHSYGDIVFSYYSLHHLSIGGINYGDGIHYTPLAFSNETGPLIRDTYIFSIPRANIAHVNVSSIAPNYKTWQNVTVDLNYSSLSHVHIRDLYILYNQTAFNGTYMGEYNVSLDFVNGYLLNSSIDLFFTRELNLQAALYNLSVVVEDICGTIFINGSHDFIVNDPPDWNLTSSIGDRYWFGKDPVIEIQY
ncbi:MAG: hypothetical protein ACTSU9_06680, partial [Promethearchaeota archaeon]